MNDAPQLIHTLLHHLSALFTRESDQILQEQLGIGFSQYKIMITIREKPATQQKQIAFALGQTEASISRQISLLQEKGMVDMVRNTENRREHLSTLSAKGVRITEAAEEILLNYQASSLEHMPTKDQAKLLELLARIHQ